MEILVITIQEAIIHVFNASYIRKIIYLFKLEQRTLQKRFTFFKSDPIEFVMSSEVCV